MPVHPDGVPAERRVFCNRTLNLRSIQAIGYDMDYTLVHYNVNAWEGEAYEHARVGLAERGLPVQGLVFRPDLVNRGLVIDSKLGNIVKANRFGYVKSASHGTNQLDFRDTRRAYARTLVDLNDGRWHFLNTLFSISEACLYAQLVDLLDAGRLPSGIGYADLLELVREALDAAHLEGALKERIMASPDEFVELDPGTPLALLDQKYAGKKLLLITNSEWHYTRFMMAYAFDRFLPDGMTWRDVFDLVVVAARKPIFFTSEAPIFEVIDDEGRLVPVRAEPRIGGCYLGGHATLVERALDLDGGKILYVGDHIYGDVNVSKQVCRWRTALVVRELEQELRAIESSESDQAVIVELMAQKEALEHEMSARKLRLQRLRRGYADPITEEAALLDAQIRDLRSKLVAIDDQIAPLAIKDGREFSARWGHLLRAGNDKSHLTRQIERYADVYTSRVSNFEAYTPFMYFRSPRGSLPHDPQ